MTFNDYFALNSLEILVAGTDVTVRGTANEEPRSPLHLIYSLAVFSRCIGRSFGQGVRSDKPGSETQCARCVRARASFSGKTECHYLLWFFVHCLSAEIKHSIYLHVTVLCAIIDAKPLPDGVSYNSVHSPRQGLDRQVRVQFMRLLWENSAAIVAKAWVTLTYFNWEI
jgi:hypothetical protein